MNKFNFTKTNLIILIMAILLLLVGYIVLSTGDRTISPILLIISYVVLIPFAFLLKKNDKN